ncbi:TonB-dependent receptor [Kordiimonas gwangyangensis]|uniref:TonB-dependent receptor n=1 Tax=Kordiimonas gwangyangensis TaxID=288022 RepID=UPI000472007E
MDAVQPGTIDAERVFDLENQLPNHRTVFTATYRPTASLSGLFRFSRYSGWKDSSFGEQAEFGSEVFLDIEMTYDVSETLQLSAGARNITNNKADEETNSVLRFLGATAPISAPFNVNGGSWYLRAQYTF